MAKLNVACRVFAAAALVAMLSTASVPDFAQAAGKATSHKLKLSGAKSLCGDQWDGSGCSVCYEQACHVVSCGNGGCRDNRFPKAAMPGTTSKPKQPINGVVNTNQPTKIGTSGANRLNGTTIGADGHRDNSGGHRK